MMTMMAHMNPRREISNAQQMKRMSGDHFFVPGRTRQADQQLDGVPGIHLSAKCDVWNSLELKGMRFLKRTQWHDIGAQLLPNTGQRKIICGQLWEIRHQKLSLKHDVWIICLWFQKTSKNTLASKTNVLLTLGKDEESITDFDGLLWFRVVIRWLSETQAPAKVNNKHDAARSATPKFLFFVKAQSPC